MVRHYRVLKGSKHTIPSSLHSKLASATNSLMAGATRRVRTEGVEHKGWHLTVEEPLEDGGLLKLSFEHVLLGVESEGGVCKREGNRVRRWTWWLEQRK